VTCDFEYLKELILLASDQPYPNVHNQRISKAKIPGIDRLRELGGSKGSNYESVVHLLLSKHKSFSAYGSPRNLSGPETNTADTNISLT
jgi:hypothetical protein